MFFFLNLDSGLVTNLKINPLSYIQDWAKCERDAGSLDPCTMDRPHRRLFPYCEVLDDLTGKYYMYGITPPEDGEKIVEAAVPGTKDGWFYGTQRHSFFVDRGIPALDKRALPLKWVKISGISTLEEIARCLDMAKSVMIVAGAGVGFPNRMSAPKLANSIDLYLPWHSRLSL